jgi:ketosteroid isomerase-like protein
MVPETVSGTEGRNMEVVRGYLQAVERLDVDALPGWLDATVVQVERPNKLYRDGQVRDRTQMLRDLPRARQVLQRQSYPIETIIASGDQVVVETRWEGVLNVPLGRLQPGDAMVAHICMVFTLKDGKIVRQVNYDCYEDFG